MLDPEYDPWPQLEGEVSTLPCEGCGDPVPFKHSGGDALGVAAEAWANDQLAVWCVACALLNGIGAIQ